MGAVLLVITIGRDVCNAWLIAIGPPVAAQVPEVTVQPPFNWY